MNFFDGSHDFMWKGQYAKGDEGFLEKGTTGAMRFEVRGEIDGREAIVLEHVTRLTDDIAPHWPQGKGYCLTIEGEPNMRITMEMEDDLVISSACYTQANNSTVGAMIDKKSEALLINDKEDKIEMVKTDITIKMEDDLEISSAYYIQANSVLIKVEDL